MIHNAPHQAPRLPRDRPPSLRTVTVTLVCAAAFVLMELVLAEWFVRWWVGVWS